MKSILFALTLLAILGGHSPGAESPAFRIERGTVLTSEGAYYWAQSRAALIPGSPARVIVMTQQIEKAGAHGYRDLFVTETTDGARTWSKPQRIDSLARHKSDDGRETVMGDVCPQWHQATRTLLVTGKTFGFLANADDNHAKDDRSMEKVAYAVYSPTTQQWSGMKQVGLPEKDHEGKVILEPNSGCHQRFDLPNGDILLPIRYRKDPKSRQYTTIVARCTFDGETLTYREHGSELTFQGVRGLYEPSVIGFGARYFLTMRADETGFVSVSEDGLHYTPPVEWKFDDGQPLGSYNAQQHWIAHYDSLYLVYSRRGANNDHVFRNRAPLFIAKVDPVKLCVLRDTEQILLPETGLDLAGGFAPVDVSPDETWVISSEMAFPKERSNEPNRVLLARLVWAQPNRTPAANAVPPAHSVEPASPAPILPKLNTNPGPEYAHSARKWQGIPGIEVSPGGRLWATWYGGPAGEGEPGNHQTLVTSGDDGRTWSDPVAVFQPEPVATSRCGDGHLWIDPQGRLWWVVNRSMKEDPSPLGPRTSWAFLNTRPDEAQPQWSGPILLGPGVSLNKPTILSTGEWLAPLDNFSGDARSTDPRQSKGAKVYLSTDHGASWAFRAAVEIPEVSFAEHMLAERRDGSLWMLARTTYGIAQSTSTDRGQTWSVGEPFTREMNVNTRFFLRRLKSGRMLLVVNDDPKARKNLTAMLSDDDGRTFPHKLLLDERSTSYPDGTETADGSLYLIYDQQRYTRDAQQILLAKVTEADILAGKVVTPTSRLAQKINRLADFGGGIDDQWVADEKIRAAARAKRRAGKADAANPVRNTPEKLEEPLKKP